jgi:hypothetical protein
MLADGVSIGPISEQIVEKGYFPGRLSVDSLELEGVRSGGCEGPQPSKSQRSLLPN